MPIRDEGDIRVLEFGCGDIMVCTTKPNEEAEFNTGIAFILQEPHVVGTSNPEFYDKRIDEVPTKVHMIFNCVESIDVVIDVLEVVRRDLIAALKGDFKE